MVTLRLALGGDHGGFPLKSELRPWLEARGYEVLDQGAHVLNPDDDYPDFAEAVARAVAEERAWRGILICGSGVGACVAANKVVGVRACLCHDTYSARQGVEHDDLNVLCLGSRVIGVELALELVKAFLDARFIGTGRYLRRLDKVKAMEHATPGESARLGL